MPSKAAPAAPSTGQTDEVQVSPGRAYLYLGALAVGYAGVYLCRKNFSVANPLIRHAFGLSKEQIGMVASYSTLAYVVGKFTFGPLIDRIGGRMAFLLSLTGVAIFGAAGGLVGSLPMLTLIYSLNRLAGSAAWGGMIKQVPDWFSSRSMAFAVGVMSLGFVVGGMCASMLAGDIAKWSGDSWRWVMSGPATVLVVIMVICWAVLPREKERRTHPAGAKSGKGSFKFHRIATLLAIRQFWIICALSFTLTIVRETFNTWTPDFFQTTAGTAMSIRMAAFLSTPFDALGAAGILLLGWVFGRIGKLARSWLVFSLLATLAVLLVVLPTLGKQSAWLSMAAVGAVGFLVYGPYSLLAGVLSVEIKGKEYVATVAGVVDGVGYLAAILSGQQFGYILDVGGYRLGFNCLASLAAVSALLSLVLYGSPWAGRRRARQS
jgi:MFS transporter, OPA family, glycerol-3-phosphate transporter